MEKDNSNSHKLYWVDCGILLLQTFLQLRRILIEIANVNFMKESKAHYGTTCVNSSIKNMYWLLDGILLQCSTKCLNLTYLEQEINICYNIIIFHAKTINSTVLLILSYTVH